MSSQAKWITFVIGAVGAFGAVYTVSHDLKSAGIALVVWVVGHFLPSPVSQTNP